MGNSGKNGTQERPKHGCTVKIWRHLQLQGANKKTMKYRKDDITGEKVNWLYIKWLRYTKAYPDSIQFKNDFDKDFRILKVSATSKRGR